MTIYVDELKQTMTVASRGGFRYREFCHLTTDGDIDDLHKFAASIGLKREWFQDHPLHPHYDLNPSKREKALENGALYMRAIDQVRKRFSGRNSGKGREI